MKAGMHGPDELYSKYYVAKTKHTKYVEGFDLLVIPYHEEMTHQEFVFVMCPERDDQAAVTALQVYADCCEATYPGLARDIRKKLAELR